MLYPMYSVPARLILLLLLFPLRPLFPLPCPLPPMEPPLRPLGIVPPDPTISHQLMPPSTTPSFCRGPELSASWFTMWLYYYSSGHDLLSPNNPPPPLLSPDVGTISPHPSIALDDYPLSASQPCDGNFPGPVPCGGSAPTSPTENTSY